ncbi:response regulator [Govanella unica]|uniref:Response regulator n=1 Tax=Govanella unica TaxID=2975056 RepID=A0A9X3TZ36_9PROT|nr:response regulator [Govania unica]MDA5194414.1 response regulator [Govania unica]
MRILLIEDDADLGFGISLALGKLNYKLDLAGDGIAAEHMLLTQSYDLIILDLGLPKMDGFGVLRQIRHRKIDTPVLILTARDSIEDRVAGLDAGADDYLVKPFAMTELTARIRALLRRSLGGETAVLRNGVLTLDTASQIAKAGDKFLKLTPREFILLELIMRKSGQIVHKSDLIDRFSDWDNELGENAIEVSIFRLRKKLAPYGITIQTIRGAGYLMERD